MHGSRRLHAECRFSVNGAKALQVDPRNVAGGSSKRFMGKPAVALMSLIINVFAQLMGVFLIPGICVIWMIINHLAATLQRRVLTPAPFESRPAPPPPRHSRPLQVKRQNVAGGTTKRCRWAFFVPSATQIGHWCVLVSQFGRFLPTCDVSRHHLRHKSPSGGETSKREKIS